MEDQGVETGGAASAAPPTVQSGLDLIGLTKVFPGGTVAVDDVNLHVEHGEYVVLLRNTVTQMVYKHAISTIVPGRAVNFSAAEPGEGTPT